MGLLDDMRVQVRVSGNAFDSEIEGLVSAAVFDMRSKGVCPELFGGPSFEGMNPLVRQAIACYVKALFGFDNADAARLMECYRLTLTELLNSSANVADTSEPRPDAGGGAA